MVEIGGKPIIWHLMKLYSFFGINDFIICCGYKGYIIKEYFSNYFLHNSDIKVDLKKNDISIIRDNVEPWNISLVDTGDETMTGGRLLRVKEYLSGEDSFCFTYGDGLSNVNINKLIEFHNSHNKKATLTAVHAPGRFGALGIDKDNVNSFNEKPKGDGSMINGGFFVLNIEALDYISADETIWEKEPLENLAKDNQLSAFKHDDFWQPMDTLRDKNLLEELWRSNKAPWKLWD